MFQDMSHPITDYYIFSDLTDYSQLSHLKEAKINNYELSLKRGVRCLQFQLAVGKKGEPVIVMNKKHENFDSYISIKVRPYVSSIFIRIESMLFLELFEVVTISF